MNPLESFLKTMHFAPCCCTLEFAEFYSRFIATLSPQDRPYWPKRLTASVLRGSQELFIGTNNKLFLADVSFIPICMGDADESRVNKHRDRARYIDDGGPGYWACLEGDGIWRRSTLPALIDWLRIDGLTGGDIFQLRKTWRANPVRLSDLLTNPSPEFLNAHRYAGSAIPLRSLESRFPQIRKFLDARFPIGTVRGVECVGNLTGPDSIHVDARELVAEHGELLPRDLRPDEFELYGERSMHFKRQVKTLSRHQMASRGYGKRTLSRAQWLATMKEPE